MSANEKQQYFDDLERSITDNGFTTVSTASEKGELFSYTIGLYKTYQQPEMIIFGLPPDLCHGIFSDIAQKAKDGTPFDLTKPTNQLLAEHDVIFVNVPQVSYQDYVLSAVWFNDELDFPVYQVVWPSNQNGAFPWEQEAAPEFSEIQPIIGQIPE